MLLSAAAAAAAAAASTSVVAKKKKTKPKPKQKCNFSLPLSLSHKPFSLGKRISTFSFFFFPSRNFVPNHGVGEVFFLFGLCLCSICVCVHHFFFLRVRADDLGMTCEVCFCMYKKEGEEDSINFFAPPRTLSQTNKKSRNTLLFKKGKE